MTITNFGLDKAREFALDYFDKYTHMAIGSSNTPELPTSTTLGTEEVRDPIDLQVKDVGLGVYDFTATFELSDAAGDTIREAGIFDSSSGGELGFRKVLPIEISKTSNQQIEITLRVSVSVINAGDVEQFNLFTEAGDNLVTEDGDNLVIQN